MGAGATSVCARPDSSFRPSAAAGVAAAAILLGGLVLRILGARGDLWLDEIWTFAQIDEAFRRHDLLWLLSSDNNHTLNTLYLFAIGADAPVLAQRGLSIFLGTAAVLAAGFAMRRAGASAVLAAMAIFAVSYPMVNYGSEARGYAGLILMTLVAFALAESAAIGSSRDRRVLGVAGLLGFLFQPIMLGSLAGVMAWTAWISLPNGKRTAGTALAALGTTARTFSWTVRLLIPVLAISAFAVIRSGGYRIAGTDPFTASGFVHGYGGLLRMMLGLPDAVPDWVALPVAAGALAIGTLSAFRGNGSRTAFYFVFLVAMPMAMFAAQLPNIHFPRYFLAPGTAFLLLLAELFGFAWRRGGAIKAIGAVLLLLVAAGNLISVCGLISNGRDQSAAVMRMIAGGGPVLVASDQDVRNEPVAAFFAHALDLPITYVTQPEICRRRPQWMLSSTDGTEMPDALDTTALGCPLVFRKVASFPQRGLSGLPWTVYRAEP